MLHREATISLDGVWDFAPGHLKCDDVGGPSLRRDDRPGGRSTSPISGTAPAG